VKHKRRKLRISPNLKKRLNTTIIQSRRDTLYRMLAKHNDGKVPCFVCGRHVNYRLATVEHIVPKSQGGTDDMDNLSISHGFCNNRRATGGPIRALMKQQEATK
jgi:5-methylcytosine-specific restriction endonuclease McrA